MSETMWGVFQNTNAVDASDHLKLRDLPAAPPWRAFASTGQPIGHPDDFATSASAEEVDRGANFVCSDKLREAVNAALYLRRPLLLTGKPGTGKSTLVYAVARELCLGPVLRWSITSRSTLRDGLYLYDALGRLNDRKPGDAPGNDDIGNYLELGPLGTALYPTDWPRALLIDEIDKSDLDLPNDLLNVFEEGEVTIPELSRNPGPEAHVRLWRRQQKVPIEGGKFTCTQFPFVVLTSNGERTFPGPFLRRCIQFDIEDPTPAQLKDIVAKRLGVVGPDAERVIDQFDEGRKQGDLATDQLLNAIFLTVGRNWSYEDETAKALRKMLMTHLAQIEQK